MPFVLTDLGAVATGLLCLIASVALTYIIRGIAAGLPNLSILGVGLNLAKIFRDAGDTIINWVVDNTTGLWLNLEGWIRGHAYLIESLGGAVVQAVNHLGDQVAHIVTQSVPNAIHAAEAAAGKTAHDLYNTAERDIGKVDSRVDTLVTRTIPHAISTAENYTDNAVGVALSLVRGEIADAKSAVESDLRQAKTDLSRSISSLADTVAHDYTSALQAAQQDAASALQVATDLINKAKAEAENVAQADANRVQQLLQQAIDTTDRTVSKLTGTVAQDLTAAEQYAQQQVAQGVSQVTGQLTATAQQLTQAINTGAAAAQAGIASDLQAAQQDANTALGQAEQTVAGALGGIYTDITGRALAYNGDLTQVAGAVGLAITGAIAGVVARVGKLEKCSVGVCDDSPNNFSNLLKDALGVASVAGVGGFLAELIDNPAQAEQKYATAIAGTITGGQHAFDLLLSL